MSRPIENVKNKNGDEIYPITCTGAVVTQSGEMLEDVIDNLESVSANVEVPSDVTPTELSNLKIGSDYYSAPSGGGGGKLYRHQILIYESSIQGIFFTITSEKSTPYTIDDIKSMKQTEYDDFGCSGYTSGQNIVYAFRIKSSWFNIEYVTTSGSRSDNSMYFSSASIKDIVTEV